MFNMLSQKGNANQRLLRFHLTPVRMTVIKKINKCWQGCGGKKELSYTLWKCKLVQPLWKSVWKFINKLKVDLSCDPAMPVLAIHLKECKSTHSRDICTPNVCNSSQYSTHGIRWGAYPPKNGYRKCGIIQL
jgi:hypothetical protein